ncbi:Serine/threonine-protein kinase smu1, partial [Coelomomyces lativittatus]
AYGNVTKTQRREKLAEALCNEIVVVPPSRLLTLLGQALKWQVQNEGPLLSGYNLFRGEYPLLTPEQDSIPTHCFAKLQLPSHCETCLFSPNGQMLFTGAADGMIEILHPLTGKLRLDIPYQKESKRMGMESAILSLAVTRDGKLLASGSDVGAIQVWHVATGVCVKSFPRAHAHGVTCLVWHKDDSQLLSGGYDGLIRLHGMKSGKLLKEFRGHTSFVNSVTYVSEYTRIFSGSSDGSVKIWESKTGNCLQTFIPANQASVLLIQLIPSRGHLLITSQSNYVVLVDAQGNTVWSLPTPLSSEIVWSALSPQGEYAYILTEDGKVTHVHFDSGTMTSMQAGEKLIGIASHPLGNLVCVWSESGELILWRS